MKERLEKTGAIQVLSALFHTNEPLMMMELQKKVQCSNETMRSAVEVLLELGLIQQKIEKGPPPRRLTFLTEKGRKVAEKLEEIEQILG